MASAESIARSGLTSILYIYQLIYVCVQTVSEDRVNTEMKLFVEVLVFVFHETV